MGDLVTPAELAARWRMSERTLQKWRREGDGPEFVRTEDGVRYEERAILAYFDSKANRRATNRALD